ncbi:MAG: amylo-alpha-1,6-glucosidase [Thiohalomonadaceae bacterium]
MDAELIAQAEREAIALLRRNLVEGGILAATPSALAEARRYTRIFGRDAAICAFGMLSSGDPVLAEGAERSLLTLADHQADNGQIPKYVDPSGGETDFWYLGCIDATLWWLLAVDHLARHGRDGLRERLAAQIRRALQWLQCQEHPRLRLLQQNEASDWADIMPRSGYVLYSNALWYGVKRRFGLPDAEATRYHFNHLFYPYSRERPDYRRLRLLTHYVRNRSRESSLYLSFVNLSFWGEEGDVLGNLLAVLFGLAGDAPAHRIVHALRTAGVDAPWPVRAVCTPIAEGSASWRSYMGRHRQNLPWRYHNGGAWPFIGGFWVLALAALGQRTQARAALAALADANRQDGWRFSEWFDGRTGMAQGMAGQSWNAAMFLLARNGLERCPFSILPPHENRP